jgi:hypothetical protein
VGSETRDESQRHTCHAVIDREARGGAGCGNSTDVHHAARMGRGVGGRARWGKVWRLVVRGGGRDERAAARTSQVGHGGMGDDGEKEARAMHHAARMGRGVGGRARRGKAGQGGA